MDTNPPESKTSGINIHLIVDLERCSDGNIDGLELDRSVKVTVDAKVEPSPIDAKEQQKNEIEFNRIVEMVIGE